MPPPAPTAASWRWSPTSSSFAPAASQTAWICGQVGGVGHRGLVDHDQVAGAEPPRPVVARGDGRPSARRSWVASQRAMFRAGEAFAGEHVGRDLGGGEPDHPPPVAGRGAAAPQVGVLPRLRQRADDEGLAGAGRADQRLDLRAGGEDAAHRGGLVVAELEPGLGQPVERTVSPASAGSAAAPALGRGG